jgi:hypothetical protein
LGKRYLTNKLWQGRAKSARPIFEALASKEYSLHIIKFCVLTIINGMISMSLISLVAFPIIWSVVFLFDFDVSSTNAVMYEKLDIIFIIFLIGTLFEVGDRFYIGIKKNKLVSIWRDKEDRH